MAMKDKKKVIEKIYRELGIRKGDVIFIHANMLPFGLVAKDKEEFIRTFLDPLRKVIGNSGTIACLAYTFSYGLTGKPYDHEKSPSEAGMFTEYIRTMKGTLRSFHPLVSVVANGPKARYITQNVPRSAFGWGSPFTKLHTLKGKCLYLGMRCRTSCTFLHYVGQMYGVSYSYNKAYFHPVYKGGKLQKGPFLAFVRNRKSRPFNYIVFEREMKKRKLLRERTFRGAPIQLVTFEDSFRLGMEILDRDPSALLEEPFYVTE